MASKAFKVNIFSVELPDGGMFGLAPFSDTIDYTRGLSLSERYKEVNGKGRRLENSDMHDGCYLLNFVSLEFAGPGRANPLTAATPIDLDPDDSFAHETALLYDPGINLAFLESGQSVMGPGAIARYFREFTNPRVNYQLIPRLDEEAAARARRFQTIRSLSMRVNVGPVTEFDRNAGIGPMQAFGEGYEAETIEIVFKAARERRRSLSPKRVWQSINSFFDNSDNNRVMKLELYGREHDDDTFEPIDLIQHRERRTRTLDIDDATRKVPHQARWDALNEIRREFMR